MHPDFDKTGGLLPAIIQDYTTGKILMLGYMNKEALAKTKKDKRVTFYSRSKQRLWTKGETSGNFLDVVRMALDCDRDTLLIQVKPHGPVCHTGADTCFNEKNKNTTDLGFLERVIQNRKQNPTATSYTNTLLQKGINAAAQKVGEEAVELIIEAKDNNTPLFLNEAADLMYHYLVLLAAKDHTLSDVIDVLQQRHKK